jgi:hypothetical protein
LRNAVRVVMTSAGLLEMIGGENVYLEIDDGVTAFLSRAPSTEE